MSFGKPMPPSVAHCSPLPISATEARLRTSAPCRRGGCGADVGKQGAMKPAGRPRGRNDLDRYVLGDEPRSSRPSSSVRAIGKT
jgi:hypothetical protein